MSFTDILLANKYCGGASKLFVLKQSLLLEIGESWVNMLQYGIRILILIDDFLAAQNPKNAWL